MRKTPLTACALALLTLLPAVAAAQEDAEEEAGLEFEAGYDHASKYLFRGLDLLGGEPVHAPHASVAFAGFSAYWYGYRGDFPNEEGGKTRYFEHDFGADYTLSVGSTSLTLGAVTYTYQKPEDLEDTTEVYAIVGLDTVLAPTFSYFHDVDLYDSGYASVAISPEQAAGPVTITPSVSLGYSLGWTDKANGIVDENDQALSRRDLNDLTLGVDVAWSKGAFGVHGLVQRSFALAALDNIDQGDFNVFTVGASFSF